MTQPPRGKERGLGCIRCASPGASAPGLRQHADAQAAPEGEEDPSRRLGNEQGRHSREAARQLGVRLSTAYYWVRQAAQGALPSRWTRRIVYVRVSAELLARLARKQC